MHDPQTVCLAISDPGAGRQPTLHAQYGTRNMVYVYDCYSCSTCSAQAARSRAVNGIQP